MGKKNHTTSKIIGTLCLALCSLLSWYYTIPSHLSHSPYIHQVCLANTIQIKHIVTSEPFHKDDKHANPPRAPKIDNWIIPPKVRIPIALIIAFTITYILYMKSLHAQEQTNTQPSCYTDQEQMEHTPTSILHSRGNTPSIDHKSKTYSHRGYTPSTSESPLSPEAIEIRQKGYTPIPFIKPSNQQVKYFEPHNSKLQPTIKQNHFYTNFMPNIYAMIQGVAPSYEPIFSDVTLLHKLIANAPKLNRSMLQEWNGFRNNQKDITINMHTIYGHYQLFLRHLSSFEPKFKDALLLHKLLTIFPNVTTIVFGATDCTGWDPSTRQYNYSPDIVSSKFILALQNTLEAHSSHSLQHIIIKTHQHIIKADCTQFNALGWYIGKGVYTTILTKNPYEYIQHKLQHKVISMIQPNRPKYGEITSLDSAMFKKLVAQGDHLSPDIQKLWDKFTSNQQSITIDIKNIYEDYILFVPLIFSAQHTNLLLLDKLAQLFPKVTEITCEQTDCTGWDINNNKLSYDYSSAIVNKNFILGIIAMLTKVGKGTQNSLKKITIKTWKNGIAIDCNVYTSQFEKLGWEIQKENKIRDDRRGANVEGTITLTKQSF